MKKRILGAGLGVGAALVAAGLLTACGSNSVPPIKEDVAKDEISIYSSFDTEYYVGQDLDVSGGIINYTKDGKTIQVSVTEDMVTGFTSEKAGSRQMVISYEGFTLVVAYEVKNIPTKISINTTGIYKSVGEVNDPLGTDNIDSMLLKFKYTGIDLYFKTISVRDGDDYRDYLDLALWNSSEVTGDWTKLNTVFDIENEEWRATLKGTNPDNSTINFEFSNITTETITLKVTYTDSTGMNSIASVINFEIL